MIGKTMKFRPKFWNETSNSNVIDKILETIRQNLNWDEFRYIENTVLTYKIKNKDGYFELLFKNDNFEIDIYVHNFINIRAYVWPSNGGDRAKYLDLKADQELNL